MDIHGRIYKCNLDPGHEDPCSTKVVVAGFEQPELGPNIWTYVRWPRGKKARIR